jgi:hypothetical protein
VRAFWQKSRKIDDGGRGKKFVEKKFLTAWFQFLEHVINHEALRHVIQHRENRCSGKLVFLGQS